MITIERHWNFRDERTISIEEMQQKALEEKAKQMNIDPLIAHISELFVMPKLSEFIMAVN